MFHNSRNTVEGWKRTLLAGDAMAAVTELKEQTG
jgi:hypothetical protein